MKFDVTHLRPCSCSWFTFCLSPPSRVYMGTVCTEDTKKPNYTIFWEADRFTDSHLQHDSHRHHLKCLAVKCGLLTSVAFNPNLGDLQWGFNELCENVAYIKPKRTVETPFCTLWLLVFWFKGFHWNVWRTRRPLSMAFNPTVKHLAVLYSRNSWKHHVEGGNTHWIGHQWIRAPQIDRCGVSKKNRIFVR